MKDDSLRRSQVDHTLNKGTFIPAVIILGLFVFLGIVRQEELGMVLNNLLHMMGNVFGGYINIISLLSIVAIFAFIIYKFGDIKIGGEDAKPLFSMFNWCAVTICGGVGTGLLFWAMGEPIFHFATPPVGAGVEPFTREAGIFAVSQTMWNWSIIQYSMYSLCAVAFAVIAYNRKLPLSFDSIVETVFGRPIKWLSSIISCVVIFCLCGAVANSMGVGLMQIGAGFHAVFGIEESPLVWLLIAIVMGIIFILSSVSGLGKGLKRISSITIYIFFVLLIYTLIFGDTIFIGKISTEAIGDMIDNWGLKTTILNTMAEEDTWSTNWVTQYYASFIVYAPVIGMFLSRMARGRTVRQFVLVNVLIPSIFCWVWIGIFGGMTVSLQYNGTVDIWSIVNELGMQATVYQILQSLPLGKIVTVVFLTAVCFSFCTLADPMASALATIAVNGLEIDDEAPRPIKILMGIVITTASYLLVASGGVDSVKGLFVIIGLLISLILILCVVAAYKACNDEIKEEESQIEILKRELKELKEKNV